MVLFHATVLPQLRDDIRRYWTSGPGAGLAEGFLRGHASEHMVAEYHQQTGAGLAAAEDERLAASELFFVGADMTTLAVTAGQSLPSYRLQPQDLPAPFGLMIFADHITVMDSAFADGTPDKIGIIGANWGATPEGVWITWLQYRDTWLDNSLATGNLKAHNVARMRTYLPAALWNHQVFWPFDSEEVNTFSRRGVNPDKDLSLERTLKSAWLLMGQSVAEVGPVVFTRNQKRALERRHGNVPQVRVIDVRRRPNTGAEEEAGSREWQHRWIVRGHWRQQWYPSLEDNRPVWIAPHIKGPEGKPMIGGDKVHTWTR